MTHKYMPCHYNNKVTLVYLSSANITQDNPNIILKNMLSDQIYALAGINGVIDLVIFFCYDLSLVCFIKESSGEIVKKT